MRAAVPKQRQSGVLIGHGHDVIAAAVRQRSTTSEIAMARP
jgi:hypothetical protein